MKVLSVPGQHDLFESASWWASSQHEVILTLRRQLKLAAAIWPDLANYKLEYVMPSKTPKQRRTMAAAAHDPRFAKRLGIPQKVAKEFNKADKRKGKKK